MNSFFSHPYRVKIDNSNIVYYRAGKGETVIFIHGITTYSFIWRSIVPYFLPKYDVIAYDLMGCGDSDVPLEKSFSLKQHASDLKKMVDKLGIKKIHLVGHDVGGGVAQIFSVNYPELLFDLTLLNSVAYDFWPVQPIIAIRTPIIRQLAMAALDFGMFKLIVKRGLYHKERLNDELMQFYFKPMRNRLKRKGLLHFAKSLDNSNLTEIEEDLRQLKIPVLIIRGNADIYLTRSIAEKLHSEIPDSKIEFIDTAGHFLQEDEPELVSGLVLKLFRNE